MKYKYTMILSSVNVSELMSFMEGTDIKLLLKIPIELTSDLDTNKKMLENYSDLGTNKHDWCYEDCLEIVDNNLK